jgi:hypothetical protein
MPLRRQLEGALGAVSCRITDEASLAFGGEAHIVSQSGEVQATIRRDGANLVIETTPAADANPNLQRALADFMAQHPGILHSPGASEGVPTAPEVHQEEHRQEASLRPSAPREPSQYRLSSTEFGALRQADGMYAEGYELGRGGARGSWPIFDRDMHEVATATAQPDGTWIVTPDRRRGTAFAEYLDEFRARQHQRAEVDQVPAPQQRPVPLPRLDEASAQRGESFLRGLAEDAGLQWTGDGDPRPYASVRAVLQDLIFIVGEEGRYDLSPEERARLDSTQRRTVEFAEQVYTAARNIFMDRYSNFDSILSLDSLFDVIARDPDIHRLFVAELERIRGVPSAEVAAPASQDRHEAQVEDPSVQPAAQPRIISGEARITGYTLTAAQFERLSTAVWNDQGSVMDDGRSGTIVDRSGTTIATYTIRLNEFTHRPVQPTQYEVCPVSPAFQALLDSVSGDRRTARQDTQDLVRTGGA